MRGDTFRWIWTTAILGAWTTFFGILILRFGLRLAWTQFTVPLALLVVLNVGFVAVMLWAGARRSVRIGAPIGGAYFAALLWMLAHYGSQWHLHTGLEGGEVWSLFGAIGVVVVALMLMPRRWVENLNAGVKCVRCGHYHEGRDCSCGCRAGQFKYPVMGL